MTEYHLWQSTNYDKVLNMTEYRLWQSTNYDRVPTMTEYWLWQSIVTMIEYHLWQSTNYDKVLTMTEYWLLQSTDYERLLWLWQGTNYDRVLATGLEICSFAHRSFAHFAQIKWVNVSDLLRLLKTNEWPRVDRSGRSEETSKWVIRSKNFG